MEQNSKLIVGYVLKKFEYKDSDFALEDKVNLVVSGKFTIGTERRIYVDKDAVLELEDRYINYNVSIVTKGVSKYSLVGGNTTKVIKNNII